MPYKITGEEIRWFVVTNDYYFLNNIIVVEIAKNGGLIPTLHFEVTGMSSLLEFSRRDMSVEEFIEYLHQDQLFHDEWMYISEMIMKKTKSNGGR